MLQEGSMQKEDLRVVKTLESIDNALLENLKKTPFSKITVEAICRSARINRTTFYKHYRDKYELMDSYMNRVLKEFKENNAVKFLEADPEHVSDDEYSVPFRKAVDFMIEKRDVYEILWTAQTGRPVFDEMVDAIAEIILKNRMASHPEIKSDPRKFFLVMLYANMFAHNFMLSIRWWFANDGIMGKEEFNEMFDDIMSKGIFEAFKEWV